MVWKKLIKNKASLFGLILLIGFILMAIFAPYLAPPKWENEPYRIPRYGWGPTPEPPSKEHPMGLTQGKYDIWYGVVWGTRTAFKVGLIVVGASCLIGVTIGSISGYYGGKFDEIIMRIVDVFMSFPFLVAAIVFTTILGKGLENVMIAMIAFRWMGYARLIRGNILGVKEEEYVSAAKASGVKNWKIILRHVLPNSIFPVLIQASMSLGSVVITASSLSFLGVGAPEGYADWGQMVSFSRNWLLGIPGDPLHYWYTVFYPGMAMVLFVLAWNLVGDAFRDIMDPKIQA
ncbi:MAG: ABC transporter permease [Firmicutes bacterium]|nr:ABC transporter permease [Bacillota bacterium]